MAEAAIEATLPGRARELAALREALAAARAGDSAAVALAGEAGIGKSALLAGLRDDAAAGGMLVLAGRAAEHERDVPFGLVVDVLDDAVAALHPRRLESLGPDRVAELALVLPSVARHATDAPGAAPGARPADRFHAHRALRALVELLGGPQPVVLVLDDLHWADAASLELAGHLLRRPPRVPHVLALAFRPVEGVAPLLDALRTAGHASELPLEPLGREDSLAVLQAVRDERLRDRLEREAAGNPLFLRELARAAAAGATGASIPRTVVAAVQREAATVPPASRTLLDGAAVAGDPFDPELAAAAAGIAPADAPALLDHLVAAGLVRPGDAARSFAFRHPLVRRALYDAAPAGWRLGAHERAAAALAARGASAAARAYHLALCAPPGDASAIETLIEAGDGARRSAPAAAVRWFDAARRLIGAGDLAALADLDYRRMLALASAGRTAEASQVGAAALERPARPASVSYCRFVEELAGLETMAGGAAQGQARVEAALRSPEGGPDAADHVRLLVARALFAAYLPDQVQRHGEAALAALGEGEGPMRAAVHGAMALGALHRAEPRRAADHAEQAAAIVAQVSDAALAERFGSILLLAMVRQGQERLFDADATFARAAQIARRTGQGHFTGAVADSRSRVALELGRVEAARELAEAAEDALRIAGPSAALVAALAHQALCLDLADRGAESRRMAEEAARMARDLPAGMTLAGARATLAALQAESDPERALATLAEAGGGGLSVSGPGRGIWLMGVAVRAELALGDVDAARRRVAEMRALAQRFDLPLGRARSDLAEAAVHLAAGDGAAAVELAARGAERAAAAGAALDAAQARMLAAVAAGDAGALRAVAAEAEALGAPRVRAEAARALRRLGQRLAPTARPVAGDTPALEALTPREREVAALVAAGSSNKQVGLALHLSEKTIEKVLSRIYAKLGTRSRVELATLVVGADGA
jgi:DNA-binding NarL/FixJ family response regulator